MRWPQSVELSSASVTVNWSSSGEVTDDQEWGGGGEDGCNTHTLSIEKWPSGKECHRHFSENIHQCEESRHISCWNQHKHLTWNVDVYIGDLPSCSDELPTEPSTYTTHCVEKIQLQWISLSWLCLQWLTTQACCLLWKHLRVVCSLHYNLLCTPPLLLCTLKFSPEECFA